MEHQIFIGRRIRFGVVALRAVRNVFILVVVAVDDFDDTVGI